MPNPFWWRILLRHDGRNVSLLPYHAIWHGSLAGDVADDVGLGTEQATADEATVTGEDCLDASELCGLDDDRTVAGEDGPECRALPRSGNERGCTAEIGRNLPAVERNPEGVSRERAGATEGC